MSSPRPRANIADISGQRMSIPTPFRYVPARQLENTAMDWRREVLRPLQHGAEGEAKTRERHRRMMKKKDVTKACCCVAETVEISN